MAENATNDKVHEDYLTVEHFAMLKENDNTKLFEIGESVAALLPYTDEIRVVYGVIFDSKYKDIQGATFDVITREGERFPHNQPRFLAHI